MTIKERSRIRRQKITGHLSHGYAEADDWDLEFWLKQTPQDRLSALVAIRNDIKKVNPERLKES
ncbi:MAG: hypothetical protein B5M56_07545 [Desulfococcus sp. 4484_241]|nr:MAG: hypothetical protein B5M56_07545 [Desulfococcus sp. 4484_241]